MDAESLEDFKARISQYTSIDASDITDDEWCMIYAIRQRMELCIGGPSSRRQAMFEAITDGYCTYCGSGDGPCHCQRDD